MRGGTAAPKVLSDKDVFIIKIQQIKGYGEETLLREYEETDTRIHDDHQKLGSGPSAQGSVYSMGDGTACKLVQTYELDDCKDAIIQAEIQKFALKVCTGSAPVITKIMVEKVRKGDKVTGVSVYYEVRIIMNQLETTLHSIVSDTYTDIEKKFMYFDQLLNHLVCLETNEIIHCDLKPENIMIQGETLHIIDWSATVSGIGPQKIMGTIQYTAPEILLQKNPHITSNIWSFGIMFVGFLLNPTQYTFGGFGFLFKEDVAGQKNELKLARIIKDSDEDTFVGIARGKLEEFVRKDGIAATSGFIDILSRCFHLDPNSRPSADELLTAFLSSEALIVKRMYAENRGIRGIPHSNPFLSSSGVVSSKDADPMVAAPGVAAPEVAPMVADPLDPDAE